MKKSKVVNETLPFALLGALLSALGAGLWINGADFDIHPIFTTTLTIFGAMILITGLVTFGVSLLTIFRSVGLVKDPYEKSYRYAYEFTYGKTTYSVYDSWEDLPKEMRDTIFKEVLEPLSLLRKQFENVRSYLPEWFLDDSKNVCDDFFNLMAVGYAKISPSIAKIYELLDNSFEDYVEAVDDFYKEKIRQTIEKDLVIVKNNIKELYAVRDGMINSEKKRIADTRRINEEVSENFDYNPFKELDHTDYMATKNS
ncbi:MAG: hypothetical protein K6F92_07370 [Lachnospiraceae bacterium]|nr:hypothetical protein [Lachnospiraceae bacterium]